MSDLGTRLKAARESLGVDLRDIASATKISVAALEALERNDYSRLPGGIFSRSFVRAYALAVGLDPEATVSEFLVALQEFERDAERNAKKPEITADDRAFLARQQRAIRQLRIGLVVVGVMVAAAIAYLVLVWWPARQAREAAGAAPSPAAAPSSPEPAPTAPPATQSATPAPASYRLAIVLDFTADCWLAVVADGVLDVRRQFRSGERHEVRARDEVVMNVGNAAAVTWSINGRSARALGRSGTTREVRVTADNYPTFLE